LFESVDVPAQLVGYERRRGRSNVRSARQASSPPSSPLRRS